VVLLYFNITKDEPKRGFALKGGVKINDSGAI